MMLEIQDLHVQFHTRNREAVSGVSLTIHDGEILGLVGESGSGKSVTAMAVAGLLPRRQCRYSGRILLDGTELLHADRAQLRRVQGKAIGVVFQEPMTSMDPLMKVGRQVEEVLELHTDLDPQQRRQAALVKPKIIVCLGRIAAKAIIKEDFKITQEHGQWFQRGGVQMTAIYHPAALLRDEQKRPETFVDLKNIQAKVRELCEHTEC